MFSQRNEEEYIIEFFKGVQGRFLDIGSYDGELFSNTRKLALLGWGGVCIEPSPRAFVILDSLYRKNESVQCYKTAICEETGQRIFYDSLDEPVSSFNKGHLQHHKTKVSRGYRVVMVNTLSILDLFNLVGYDFEFINIDTEGLNFYILDNLPFNKLSKVRMICMEFYAFDDTDKNRDKKILEEMGKYKFRLLHKTDENLILVR